MGAAGLRTLGVAAKELVTGTGEALGLTGERAAIQRAESRAIKDTLAGGSRSQSFPFALEGGSGRWAESKRRVQVEFQGRRAETAKALLEGLDKAEVPLPPGAAKLLPLAMRYGTAYRYYVLARLLALRDILVRRGTPVALRGARAITRVAQPR